jgi:hypothetical protein
LGKLFKNNPTPANDSRALAIRYEPREEAPAKSGPVITTLGALASRDQGRNGEAESLKVARTFDSIGRRNEGLRTHLDGIELSFRDIEAIRSQFYEALGPIDQTLIEIERTKVAHLETERKFEGLSEAHERLRRHPDARPQWAGRSTPGTVRAAQGCREGACRRRDRRL